MRSLLYLNYGGEEPREFAVVRDRIPASRLGVKVRSHSSIQDRDRVRSPLSRFAIAFSHIAAYLQAIEPLLTVQYFAPTLTAE